MKAKTKQARAIARNKKQKKSLAKTRSRYKTCNVCNSWMLKNWSKCRLCDWPEISEDEAKHRRNFWKRGPGYLTREFIPKI